MLGDTLQAGQEDDDAVAQVFPDAHDDDGGHGPGGAGQPGRGGQVQAREQIVEQAEVRAVDPAPDHGHGHSGRNHRHEVDSTQPQAPAQRLVEGHGEGQGDGDAYRHGNYRVVDGVEQHAPEEGVFGDLDVVLQTDELRRRDEVPTGEAEGEGSQDREEGEQQETNQVRHQEQYGPACFGAAQAAGTGPPG